MAFILGEAEFDYSNPHVCYKGGGSGGGGTTTSSSSVSANPQAMAAYQQALSMANNAASAPLQQYQGQQVANFTPQQLQAFQTVQNSQGSYQPYLNTASQDIQGSTAPLWSNVQQFNPSTMSQYESPYTQQVVGATEAQLNNQNAQQQNQVVGNAVSSGAWGGDRSAVAQAQTAGQQALAEAPTIAGLENTGYSQALGEFNQQQQAQLGANEANAYLGSQAGFGNMQLAQQATNLPLTQANAEYGMGSAQQQLSQEQLNIPYEQFLQQQAYPFQTAQFYSNIAEGIGPGMGSSSTGSETVPGASTASQIGGGLLGLGGLTISAAGNAGGFGNLFSFQRGGAAVKRMNRATGGGNSSDSLGLIDNIPDDFVDFVPLQAGVGTKTLSTQLPNYGTNGGGSSGSSSGLSSLTSLGGSLGKLMNPNNSGNPSSSQPSGGGLDSVLGNLTGNYGSGPGSSDAAAYMGSSSASQVGSDVAAQDAAGSSGSWLSSLGDSIGSLFSSGGKIPQYDRKHLASGGHADTWMSDVGDGIGSIIGAIYGGPIGSTLGGDAGTNAGMTLGDLFGGKTNLVGQDMLGSLNPSYGQQQGQGFGNLLNKGGRIHKDLGGGLTDPMSASPQAFNANPNQQNQYQQISQLPMDKLQELKARIPQNSPQYSLIQRALQQKQFMPNSGTQTAMAGLSAPTAPQGVAPAVQNPLQQPQAGMAIGGRLKRDGGGDIPAQNIPVAGVDTVGSPTANDVAQYIPPMNAAALQAPTQSGSALPPQYSPQQDVQSDVANEGGAPAPTGGMPSSPAPQPQTERAAPTYAAKPERQQASADPWMALATAGFAMMAGKSPNAMTNIGAGAQAGLQAYANEKKEAATQNYQASQLDNEAQKMADEADYRNKQLGQAASEFNTKQTTMTPYEKAQLDRETAQNQATQKNALLERTKPIPDGFGGFIQLDPDSGKYIPVSPVGPSGSGQSISNLYNPPKDDKGNALKGDAFLATLPPAVALQAKSYLAGNSPPPTGFALKSPTIAAAYEAAQQADDNFNQTAGTRYNTIQDFAKGPQTAKTVQSQNVVMEHIQTLRSAVDALHNGDIKAFNAVANTIADQAGKPQPNNFELGRQLVSDEIAKAVLGTAGGVTDREQLQKSLSPNASQEQAYGALDEAGKYMAGQASGLEQRYKAGTGLDNYRERWMTAPAKSLFDRYYPKGGQSQAGQTQQPVGIPPASQRQAGQVYTNPNGVSAKWTGTGWVPQ